MVFESILADLLNRFLGDYVQNFDRSQLKLGIWGGDVTLKHLDVKESALDDLDLPVRVISGHLGRLILKIPWKNMYTAPVIATVEGLYIVVIPNLAIKYDAEKEEKAAELAKKAELERIEEAKLKEAQKKDIKEEKKDTFTEKLVTQIIKNLQVKIKDIHIRYEDTVSDRQNPFSFGFTLHNLSFETTDEKWIPTIIQENVSIIHKLITLDSLAFYWNSNTKLFSHMNPEERQASLENTIASSAFKPSNVAYMLGPINSTAQLKLNSKPENDDFKEPKVWLNVVMEEIAVGLSKRQYRDLMKMLEAFDRMTVANLYRKYRPDVPHPGHAKEWWNFAITAILEEEVRRKKKNWSWENMKQHRQQCKIYKELYVFKLTNKKLPTEKQQQLCECEKQLDLFNITVARKQAELEHSRKKKHQDEKPKTWGGWVGSWFSSGPTEESTEDSTGKKIVKQFEEAMTNEEKSKLYEAIGYQEQASVTEYPKEFVENKLLFLLENLTLLLSDDTSSEPQVVKANLRQVSASVSQRPSAQAMSVDAKMESFVVNGVPSPSGHVPTIVSSQKMSKSVLPLLSILFETNPLDGSCDHKLGLDAQPLEVIYDANTINRLSEVFKPPEQVDLQQLQAAALIKLEEVREMSAFGLQYAIEQHKHLELRVDIKPSFVIIPEYGVYKENVHMIVLSLGNFRMDSLQRDLESPTVRSMVKAGSTEDEVITTMMDKAYDKFHIAITNAEVLLLAPNDNWKDVVNSSTSTLHLLHPVSLNIDFHKSIVTIDPRMPKIKIAGELPLLDISMSDEQLLNMLHIATSIPLPQVESEAPSETAKIRQPSAVVDINTVNAKVLNQAKREAVETYKTGSSSDTDEAEEKVDTSRVQTTELELKFEIKQFEFAFSHHADASDVRTLRFSFSHFGTCVTMRTFDLIADLYLGGILLEYSGIYTRDGLPIKLLFSTINECQENLFTVKYLQADKKGPDFATTYNSTLQNIDVNFKDINFILHQDVILAIMAFSNKLVSKLESVSAQQQRQQSISTPVTHKEAKDVKGKLEKSVVTKRKKPSEIIDMRVAASLDALSMLVCNDTYDLTNIEMKGMKGLIVMDKVKTDVSASWKDLIVSDPSPDALYMKVITAEAGEVLDLQLALYNNATDDENYLDLNAVDISVTVSFGRMKVVFLNKFVSSLLFFLDHFQAAKEKVAQASAVAAEAAKQGIEHVYEKATRISLQIVIQAPVIIVPQNSSSKNTLVADLGVLHISNKFEFGKKRNELGIPAVLDKMVLNLENLKLSRAIALPKTNAICAECLLLEPLSFSLAVVRNLSSGWYIEQPEVDVFGRLKAVKMFMSNEDYATVMSVLSENMAETHEVLKTDESELIIRTTAEVTEASATRSTTETVQVKVDRPAQVEDFIPHKTFTRFRVGFEMDSAMAMFYFGKTELTKSINERDPAQSMGVMNIQCIHIEAEMYSNSSMNARVVLQDFTLDDTRACRTKGIKRLMERTSDDESGKMITVLFNQNPFGEKTLDVKVCSFTLVACLPYIMKLGEFFGSMETSESKSAATNVTLQQETKKPHVVTNVPASTASTIITVKVEQPDIVLIEDMENPESNAVFLNNEINAKITLTDTNKVISGKISNLTFYTACYNKAKRLDSMVRILNPSEIDLQCNMSQQSQHIDLLFKDIVLQISPSTVELITNIMSSLVTEKVAEVEKVKEMKDYSDLWDAKTLNTCNFSFLETLSGREKAIEASEAFMDTESEILTSEQMLFTVRKVIITVEAGVGNRTVPMLLLESSFQAQICDWTSEIAVESSLSIEISYYNEKIAVWEPLLEPVETSKGHRSWELFMEMSKRGEIEQETAEELGEIPPALKFEVRSDDIMELTVSKTCLEVLTALSEAFTEAVKQTTVRDSKLPYAPYRVYNYLGMPVTIVLNGMFQILDATENYGSVILESGSPPLHLTQELKTSDARARPSVLKKQFIKEDTFFNIKIASEDMSIERQISVACTDKRFFLLPRRTYPGDKWGFIVDITSLYGCKVITFHSNLQVYNHFAVPIDVYYMISAASEVKWCGTVEPNKILHLPMYAVYTVTGELFFKPTNQPYSLSLEPFVWKHLIEDPSINKIVQCNFKNTSGHSFFINVAGDVERILYEETNKKTVASSLYKLNLYPTVRLRNLLLYPVNYSVQGLDKDFKLEEGQTDELWPAEIGKTGLEIRLHNYLDRTWVCYRTLSANIDELSVWTFSTQVGDVTRTMELGMHTQKINGSIIMELYSPYCMINKTGLLLIYRRSKKVEKSEGKERKDEEGNIIYHPAEVEKAVLFSFKAKAFFSKKKASLKIKDSEWSDKFSIDAVGSSGNVIAKSKNGRTYGIGVQIKLSQSGLSKMIIFTPFYILVNNCSFDIECLEEAENSDWIKVKKDECIPFWPNDTVKAVMVARYYGDNCQTEPFSFKDNQNTLLRLNSSKGGINVDCQVAQSSIILTFEDYSPGQAPVLIVNHMSEYYVTFNQVGCKEEKLNPYSCIMYSWTNPTAKRILQWKCGDKKDGQHDLVKDEVGEFHPEPNATAYWLSFLDGMQRVLVFTHDLNRAFAVQTACQTVQMDQEFVVMLQGVGISLVNNDTKLEIMYLGITSTGIIWEGKKEKSSRFKPLSLKECILLETGYQRYQGELKIGKKPQAVQSLEGKLEVDYAQLKMLKPSVKNLKRTFQTGLWLEYKASPGATFLHAKINRLQIDNQLADCVFPVVLAPVPLPKSVAAESAPKPFTELSIMLRKEAQTTVQQIKYCKILIQEFHIKLDQGFINSMISFFTPEEPTEINYVKVVGLDCSLAESGLKDVAAIYSSQEQKCYYDNLHFSPLKVHISFSMTGGGGSDGNKPTPIHSDLLNILLQSVGVTLTEIQDVIFKLDYFERKHAFMSSQQLINEATSHYIGQAVKQLYMLVLGLDVIGNPVGLFLGLGEGVTDFFYEPFQGAIQGPEEFFEGLGLGVKSLFGHAIGGTAGAASRIAGTLGKGIAALTLDKDYQRRRRQNLNRRPQEVTQRLAQSGKGLVMGVFDGMTGIVRQPWEGAKEEGGWGFAKGMAKGLIGIVARPTAGAVDFVSGTFDSVKRIAELQEEVKRLRPPRYIRADGVIRPYIKLESEGNRILQELEKGKYVSTDVYEGHIVVGTDQKSCLVVTNNRIMYVTKGDVFGQWNTEWEYRWEELRGTPSVTESGIKIMLKDPHRKKMSFFGSKVAGKLVHATNLQQCQWLVSKIEDIMKNQR